MKQQAAKTRTKDGTGRNKDANAKRCPQEHDGVAHIRALLIKEKEKTPGGLAGVYHMKLLSDFSLYRRADRWLLRLV